MRRTAFCVVMACVICMALDGAAELGYADAAHVPHSVEKTFGTSSPPIEWPAILDEVDAYQFFTSHDGRNGELRALYPRQPGEPLQGGEVVETDVPPDQLFGTPRPAGGGWIHLGGVVSIGAEALRVQVDGSGLGADDELWVLGVRTGRAFGPYTSEGVANPRWLASVQGDEAVLLVVSPSEAPPSVRLTAYSHIFLSMRELAKELDCNIDIACETDPGILEVSASTGIMLVGGKWFCSGNLVNNEMTAAYEPFFLTANHCICSDDEVRDTEVYWDFRSSACGLNDAPGLDSLPRSTGASLLATSARLDATLMRLDSVPNGVYGRTYAGWDARRAVRGENVLAIHYPDATHARISKGVVMVASGTGNGREEQIEVLWEEGVTEGGSSGSGLLYAGTNRIAGMLSSGTEHICGTDRSGNLDWFASIRGFYPQIAPYLDTATPSTVEGDDDCKTATPTCPFFVTYSSQPALLARFRALRDNVLLKSDAGERFVAAYYQAAPAMADAVARSPRARGLFAAITGPLARLGER
ncbi:MAG: hypothetical protein GWP08_18950 [Nitrospiraceae bacterium]|nr:hypothetical protein [Nitrospiraceae bacterium]